MRRLLIALVFVATAGLVNADTATAAQVYRCQVGGVTRTSTTGYKKACEAAIRAGKWSYPDLKVTGVERGCPKRTVCKGGSQHTVVFGSFTHPDGVNRDVTWIARAWRG